MSRKIMKHLFLSCLVLLFGSTLARAQGQQPAATPQPQPTVNMQAEILKKVEQSRRLNRGAEELRNGGRGSRDQELMRQIARQRIEPLYRDLTKDESRLLAPNPADLKKYARFLSQPNSGIAKLAPDYGCSENTSVVVASAECLKYSMPGNGSSYSFRVNNYRIPRLADISFTKSGFQSIGVLQHGIMVDLGDVPLEEVSLATSGLKFLTDFLPITDFQKAKETDLKLVSGISDGGFLYRRRLPATENTTFVLRSIAYRGTFYRAVEGLTYNELDFDKRQDITVAFRVVRRDADGSVTILWKKLDGKKAPAIRQNKESLIKENKFIAAGRGMN